MLNRNILIYRLSATISAAVVILVITIKVGQLAVEDKALVKAKHSLANKCIVEQPQKACEKGGIQISKRQLNKEFASLADAQKEIGFQMIAIDLEQIKSTVKSVNIEKIGSFRQN